MSKIGLMMGCFCLASMVAGAEVGRPLIIAAGADGAVGNLRVAKDFKLDLIYSVPKATQGSWVAMCTDPKGRLIVSDQHGELFRVSLPAASGTAPRVEPIDLEIGGAHGLLYAFDSLYAIVGERNVHGLYRLRSTHGDDRFDDIKLLRKLEGGGEHGPHAILLSPDRKSLFVVCGNDTKLTPIDSSRVPLDWGEDHLLPPMPDSPGLAPSGWIAKTDPDGKSWELIASGFRNEFSAAFNREGELFTYDSDMEWDLNTPWYRPTRLNHVISGADFGFREGSGKWPEWYIDSFGAMLNVGTGSPTGMTFGYAAKFPAKYQEALFVCDWSYGKLYAAQLAPAGASYTAQLEEFITGQPLPLTQVLINPADGAMYFIVGGRGTQSALYRVTYIGTESTAPQLCSDPLRQKRELRRELESFHGHRDGKAIEIVWPHLADQDRALRYAARIALEWQDPREWREKALAEKDPRTAIAALVALARISGRDEPHRLPPDAPADPALRTQMLAALAQIGWSNLPYADRLDLMRAYALVFTRLGRPDEPARQQLIEKLDRLFPAQGRELNAELAQMLVYLQSPAAAAKLIAAIHDAPTQEEQLEYARSLRLLKAGWTIPLREEYFRWFLTAANFRGGQQVAYYVDRMKADAIATLSGADKAALKPILEMMPPRKSPLELIKARAFVKAWTTNDLVPIVERGLQGGRSFERGRKLFGEVGCAACHHFASDGGMVGPDLTQAAGRFSVHDLLESIVEPSKIISDRYAAIIIRKKDGQVITGRVVNLDGDTLNVVENMFEPGTFTNVKRPEIQSMETSKVSMMPEGLLNSLKEDEVQDLVAFLLSRDDPQGKMFR